MDLLKKKYIKLKISFQKVYYTINISLVEPRPRYYLSGF